MSTDTPLSSAHNPTVKHLRHLATSSKYRRQENLAIASGTHLAQSCLAAGTTPTLHIYAESALSNPEIATLKWQLDDLDVPSLVLRDSLYETVGDVHATQGISIIFTPDAPQPPASLDHDAVLLDDIQDPGNLGTILRTTAASGVEAVYLSPGCASPWSPKALRAGMGAQFGLAVYESVDLASLVAESRVPTAVTSLAPDSQSLYTLDLRSPQAWVFGSEGQGVSLDIAALASARVTIPQAVTPVESLNVAASVAVCLYEQHRQRLA